MYNPSGVLHKEEVTNNRQRSLTGGHIPEDVGSNPTLATNKLWDRAEAARKAHNLEVGGSNPSPATNVSQFPEEIQS